MKNYIKKRATAITLAACLVMSCVPINAEEFITETDDFLTVEQTPLSAEPTFSDTADAVETADAAENVNLAAADEGLVDVGFEETPDVLAGGDEDVVFSDSAEDVISADGLIEDDFFSDEVEFAEEESLLGEAEFETEFEEELLEEEIETESLEELALEEETEGEEDIFTESTDELNADSTEVTRLTLSDFGVASHTPDEIRNFIRNHPSTFLSTNYYKTAPSLKSPYSPGELSDEVKNLIVNRYNTYRYIAGLNYDVTMDSGLQASAQLGALTLSYNERIAHSVSAIPGMSGAGTISCISGVAGPDSVKDWVDDPGDKNIVAGHRSDLFYPGIVKIGIGSIFGQNKFFSASSFNSSIGQLKTNAVVWPAQTMPVSMMGKTSVWSVNVYTLFSLLGNKYPDKSKIKVTVTGTSGKYNGKKWEFSEAKSDGIYSCHSNYYLSFLPNDIKTNGYSAGDSFHVIVSYSENLEISYDVSFVDLCNGNHTYAKNLNHLMTDAEAGDYIYECTTCGATQSRHEAVTPPPASCSHSWSKWIVTSIGTQSYKKHTCTKCGKEERIAISPEEAYELMFGPDDGGSGSGSGGSGSGTTTQTGTRAQKMTVTVKSPSVKYSKLKKKNQTIKKANAFIIKNAKGTVTFKKVSGNSKITISKAGKITLKKGLKKKTYSLKVKVTAAGNKTYKKKSKTVTVKIRVK